MHQRFPTESLKQGLFESAKVTMRYYCPYSFSRLFLLFIFSCLTVTLCLNTTQVEFMKQLSTYSYDWKKRISSSDPCLWDGVSCSKNGVDVVELHLSGFWFTGNIWKTVCKLPALQILDLSYNNLSIPSDEDIRSCTGLVALDVGSNYMSGNLPSLNSLQNLQSLDMSYNKLQGGFGAQIQNLTEIRTLNFTQNNFNGSIAFGGVKLEVLDLSHNQLVGEFPTGLTECTNLTLLDLSSNSLSGPIPDNIGSFVNLKTLLLFSNGFTGNIPKTLGAFTKLTQLAMNQNRLSGAIPFELSNITGLKSLDLSHNRLTDSVPAQVFSLSNLQTLDFSSNLLSGGIPQDFSKKLFSLRIGNNKLNGSIPSTVSNAPNLTYLEMNNNFLNGPIPEQLANCTELQRLDLGHNDLRGTLTYVLPTLLQLQYLMLSNNKFEGVIPDELSNMSDLRYVDLSGNRLSGSISSKIVMLQQLQKLLLQNNHLTGIIPHNIEDGKSLLELQLGGNNLTGTIPPGIGNLDMLQIALNLSCNSLEGRIPTSLSSLVRLNVLDFSNNRLTGELPVSLASMKSLTILDLSYNELKGEIPISLSNLIQLDILNFSNNRLTGEIPESLVNINMEWLTVLNLSNNELKGKNPVSLANLKSLTILDLSNNELQGEIPVSLANIKRLRMLDLSNNELIGQFPESLANMNWLTVLDLSNNKLTVIIPESLRNMKSLTELDLSNNELKDNIPSGNSHSTTLIKVLGALGAVSIFVVCCLLLQFLWIRILRGQGLNLSRAIRKILQRVEHPRISYEELVTATDRFNESNLLATSSFSSVYKGVLTDGTQVAVKVLNLTNGLSDKIFKAECRVLQNVRHRNLARIITSCSNLQFKALIFEFFPSGSLERHLYLDGHHVSCELGLKELLIIAIDIAHAVEYLHYDCTVQIVHCDIKPSNVLLDEDMTAHLSDFGIARLMGRSSVDSLTSTMDLKGSVGYIAPEYGLSGMLSPRGDVYSYGILLLEMLTRKRPTDSMFEGGLNLHKWVNSAFPSRAVEVVEKSLLGQGVGKETEECLISLIRIGLLCSRDSPDARPTIRDVSTLLKNIQEDWTRGTNSSMKSKPTIANLLCDRGTTFNCEEASDTQSSTF